jgi:hypothetical protein
LVDVPPKDEAGKFEDVTFDFLIADLELGTTLARIAHKSDKDLEKRSRDLRNARRAYDVVRRLAARAMLSEEQQIEFDDKAARLKTELEKLGEVFWSVRLWHRARLRRAHKMFQKTSVCPVGEDFLELMKRESLVRD